MRKVYIYNRKKLYEEVWKEPMIIVSKRYGISHVALKRACVKLQIPTPGNGYWTIARSGGQVERPPLPKYTGPKLFNPEEYERDSFFKELDHHFTKYDEESDFNKLKSEALDWELAMTIREYIQAVENRVLITRMPLSEKNRIRKQLKWAKGKADWLDPIIAADDPLMGKKHYKRLFFDG